MRLATSSCPTTGNTASRSRSRLDHLPAQRPTRDLMATASSGNRRTIKWATRVMASTTQSMDAING